AKPAGLHSATTRDKRTIIVAAAYRPDSLLGMESGFGQQQRLGSPTWIASAQAGDPPATRRFKHLTSADSRESEVAAAPKHRSRRRDARMHPLRFRPPGRVARECRLQHRLF